ncbi:MAG: cache domain-containing protein [Gemmatimonadota bacterium]|nr:cache domain-containing protein [Gemmatimonadota bacterium]
MRSITPVARAAALLFLVITASARPAHAQVPKVTAGEVVDRETLKGFVTWATSEFAKVTTIAEGSKLLTGFRVEGSDWNVGNMYLILFATTGHVFIHGEDPNIDGKNAVDVVDDNGMKIIQEILAAGATEGGGFVEWCWDDPHDPADVRCKDAYALKYFSQVAGRDFVVVGGYYQDLSHAGTPLPDIPLPEVSAADVVDRETLRQFVHGSFEWFQELIRLVGFERANEWKAVLREDGGHFRSGPIYLFFFTADGYVIFHGANPWREGRFAEDIVDINGVPFFELLIAAAQAGGGFVEYFWDDPTVEGDEDTGSPKVSYALSFTNNDLDVYQGQEFILGAGFYRNFSTAEAEMAAEDWLHRFGRSVASQAMEMIGHRVSHAHRADDHLTVGGRAVGPGGSLGLASLGSWLGSAGASGTNGPAGLASLLPPSTRGLLGGSSFQVSPGASEGGGGYSVWGGGEVMRFTSGDGEGFGNGEVTTGALGADYESGSVVTGLAVTYSTGSGRFELGRPGDDDVGDVSTTLTSAFPYARLAFGDRLFTWGVLGYGTGRLGIEGGGEVDPDSDITMQMAGLGAKGALVHAEAPNDFELALRADAFIARMHSAEIAERRELNTDASRMRLMLEGSTGFALGSGTLQPQARIGMRQDGGEVDSGFGMELGGGMTFLDRGGTLTIRVHGRMLVLHEENEYEEWGLGGSITVNPGGGGRGLSLGVRPSWGSTASGVARLWAQGAAGLTQGGYGYGSRRVDAEVGYGFQALEGRGLFTPYARVLLSERLDAAYSPLAGFGSAIAMTPLDAANQGIYGYQLGGRMSLGPDFAASFEGGRGTGAPGSGASHRAALSLSLRW